MIDVIAFFFGGVPVEVCVVDNHVETETVLAAQCQGGFIAICELDGQQYELVENGNTLQLHVSCSQYPQILTEPPRLSKEQRSELFSGSR